MGKGIRKNDWDRWYTASDIIYSINGLNRDNVYNVEDPINALDAAQSVQAISKAIMRINTDGKPVVIPVNIGNRHWVALVLRKGMYGEIQALYADSLANVLREALPLFTTLENHGVSAYNMSMLQQNDKCNCGPLTAINLHYLATHGQVLEDQEQIATEIVRQRNDLMLRRELSTIDFNSYDEWYQAEGRRDEGAPELIDKTPAPNRRLDSLARLVVGEDVCAAVCSDGSKIVIASNSGLSAGRKAYIKTCLDFISRIAKGEFLLDNIAEYAEKLDAIACAAAFKGLVYKESSLKDIKNRTALALQRVSDTLTAKEKKTDGTPASRQAKAEDEKAGDRHKECHKELNRAIQLRELLENLVQSKRPLEEDLNKIFKEITSIIEEDTIASKMNTLEDLYRESNDDELLQSKRNAKRKQALGKAEALLREFAQDHILKEVKMLKDGANPTEALNLAITRLRELKSEVAALIKEKKARLESKKSDVSVQLDKLNAQIIETKRFYAELLKPKRFLQDIKKIVSSLATDSKKPFTSQMREALSNLPKFINLEENPHAETAILEVLVKDEIIPGEPTPTGTSQKLPLGTSKKCCGDCDDAVATVNEYLQARAPGTSLYIAVERRAVHGNRYPGWSCPPLLQGIFKNVGKRIPNDEERKEKEGNAQEAHFDSESEPECNATLIARRRGLGIRLENKEDEDDGHDAGSASNAQHSQSSSTGSAQRGGANSHEQHDEEQVPVTQNYSTTEKSEIEDSLSVSCSTTNNKEDEAQQSILLTIFSWIKDLPQELIEQILSSSSMQQIQEILELDAYYNKLSTSSLNKQSIEEKFALDYKEYYEQEAVFSTSQEYARASNYYDSAVLAGDFAPNDGIFSQQFVN